MRLNWSYSITILFILAISCNVGLAQIDQNDENGYNVYEEIDQLNRLLSMYEDITTPAPIVNVQTNKRTTDLFKYRPHTRQLNNYRLPLEITGAIFAILCVTGLAVFGAVMINRRRTSGKFNTKGADITRFVEPLEKGSPQSTLIGSDIGDKKLAYSAQMYHYQHQRQQMLAMEKAQLQNKGISDDEMMDDDTYHEFDDNDGTVYEFQGFCSIKQEADIEVPNPLFRASDVIRSSCSSNSPEHEDLSSASTVLHK